jgi:arylsulfatase A-like enzyme
VRIRCFAYFVFLFSGVVSAKQPNVIVYMVDDLGWNHVSAAQTTMGTHDKLYHTPHLEKLANAGLSFTHAYAQPNCAPTRAAMLSGQYPARIHNDVYVVGNLNRNSKSSKGGAISKKDATFIGPKQTEDVAAAAITIAEAMKKNGYATAHIGKYHVGGHSGDETLPENVGFDINLGGFKQGHQPTCFAKKAKGSDKYEFKGVGRGDFDRFGQPYTEAYVKRRKLPQSLVGTPKHISDALGDALEETVGKLTTTNKPFYLQFHAYAVHGPVQSRPDLKTAALKRAGGDARKANYAGFVSSVDENIGRMLEVLRDPNGDGDTGDSIEKDTVIFFTSDNGGTHADNLPLRGKKGMLTEGGMRVPLVAYWPGVIPAGAVTDRVVHVLDYYPTCLELAGSKWMPPASEHPLDGESFVSVLKEPAKADKRGPLFFLFPGYMDSRAQPTVVGMDEIGGKRYKLLYYYEGDRWELFCTSDDVGEEKNIFSSKPEVAKQLSAKIDAWLKQEHPTWKPKYPIRKSDNQPAGPPPAL